MQYPTGEGSSAQLLHWHRRREFVAMKQMGPDERGFERKTKRTHKRELLDKMGRVVPWAELV